MDQVLNCKLGRTTVVNKIEDEEVHLEQFKEYKYQYYS